MYMLFCLHVHITSAISISFMVQFSIKYLLEEIDKLGRNNYQGVISLCWFPSLTSMNAIFFFLLSIQILVSKVSLFLCKNPYPHFCFYKHFVILICKSNHPVSFETLYPTVVPMFCPLCYYCSVQHYCCSLSLKIHVTCLKINFNGAHKMRTSVLKLLHAIFRCPSFEYCFFSYCSTFWSNDEKTAILQCHHY